MGMRCVIMQPTFIPWSGYFNLISEADEFVFLDDVQFEKRSWQSRNAILVGGKRYFLSLQVSKGNFDRKIDEVLLFQEPHWRQNLCKTLIHTYGKHPFPEAIEPALNALKDVSLTKLSEFNINIIEKLCQLLGLETKWHRSSEIGTIGKRSEKLLAICNTLNCSEYLSPIGAKDYIEEDNLFSNSNITVTFQNFSPGPYVQKNSDEFISHLSIVDVIANIGPKAAAEYIKTGNLAIQCRSTNE